MIGKVPVPSGFRVVKVADVTQLGDVLAFTLVSADAAPLPRWEAGAHVDLMLDDGLIRQYSLCGDPMDSDRYQLAVLLDPQSRGGSRVVHDRVRTGAILRIGPPRNLFPLDPRARCSILIGGGIGITPLIAMAYELQRAGQDFTLHYISRDPVFAEFLTRAPFVKSLVVHHRGKTDAPRFDPISALGDHDRETHVYCCGPLSLMNAVTDAGKTLGYADDVLHQEAFSAQPVIGGDAFTVLAARSDVRVIVGDSESVATALKRAGVSVHLNCEQGICGTCVATVIEGEPDHRDEYLTSEERADQIVLCCSRSKTPLLVLDL
ncbi:vanillate O-demethylase oxidoreductase subunit [Acetobacter aceti]|uniref:Vanillate O-demethylase oxidoreductase subunit n=2 Tax=Acetobacter aceti TaxID=435 RepID=A0A1U9KDN9_ACEAC|nr:vanillate O-demethylase oxidoreductase subunit [Acetobacter aceti]